MSGKFGDILGKADGNDAGQADPYATDEYSDPVGPGGLTPSERAKLETAAGAADRRAARAPDAAALALQRNKLFGTKKL